MKKKILIISILSVLFALVLAFSASAENKIIKLDTCPTLEEIHANPDAYISHLDEFDDAAYETYRTADSSSVVVMFDNQATPTYYVYPAYYLIRSSYWYVSGGIAKLNETIAAVNASQDGLNAFAGYTSDGGTWGKGECDYIVRVEVPTYVTTIHGQYKFEGSVNVKEVYFPVHTVIDEETGEEKTVSYVTSVSGENLFSSCRSLEYIHNSEYLPIGIVQGNAAGLTGCSSLKEFKVPYGVTTIYGKRNNGFFQDCSSLTEIVLPNTVTSIGKQAFSGCTSLKTIKLGASFSSFYSENSDYETFSYVSLNFVYAPESFVNSITATANNYKSIFNNTSAKTIYFITTDDATIATTIRDNFKATNANANIGNIPDANIVKYDPAVDYVELQKALTSSMIVYGYNLCDAFYDSNHKTVEEVNDHNCTTDDLCRCKNVLNPKAGDSHNEQLLVVYKDYTKAGTKTQGCTNDDCTVIDVTEELEPIFEALGYSIKNDGCGITTDYKVNPESLAYYKTYLADNGKTFTFGVFIGNSEYFTGDAFVNADGTMDNSFSYIQAVNSLDYSKVKCTVADFTLAEKDLPLVMGIYVIDDGKVSYVQHEGTYEKEITKGDVTLDVVTITKIADLSDIDLALPEAKALPVENKEN